MEKTYKAFVALVLDEGFNILVYKNAFVYFKVTYSHETSKYLALILLWGLCLQYLIKKKMFRQTFFKSKFIYSGNRCFLVV